jgi:hypothetical protein
MIEPYNDYDNLRHFLQRNLSTSINNTKNIDLYILIEKNKDNNHKLKKLKSELVLSADKDINFWKSIFLENNRSPCAGPIFIPIINPLDGTMITIEKRQGNYAVMCVGCNETYMVGSVTKRDSSSGLFDEEGVSLKQPTHNNCHKWKAHWFPSNEIFVQQHPNNEKTMISMRNAKIMLSNMNEKHLDSMAMVKQQLLEHTW